MKSLVATALAVSFAMPATLAAEGGPPPAIITQINLGGAGLLSSYYAPTQKALTGARGGQDGPRLGTVGAGGPTTGYEHDTFSVVPGLSGSKMIQNGTAFFSFGVNQVNSKDQPNITQNETKIPGISLNYDNFSNPNSAWGVGLSYSKRDTKSKTSPVTTGAKEFELSFRYAKKLSEHWGFTNQSYLTSGETFVTTPGGTTNEDELTFYTQFEAVGAFGPDDIGIVPDGWKIHPVFGVSYQNKQISSGGTNTTEKDGSVWAKAVLAKGLRPGSWAPNVTVGLEHVYLTDTGNQFLNEQNYAILGVGAQYLAEGGSLLLSFERRQGLKGERVNNSLVAAYTFDF